MAAVVPGGPAGPGELRGSEHSEAHGRDRRVGEQGGGGHSLGGRPDRVGPGGSAEGNEGKEIPEADLG